MPRIILKSPYLKPGQSKHLKQYVKYIATREGVERVGTDEGHRPVEKQTADILQELIKQYPDARDLFEYEDYRAAPNQENANALVMAITECHPELFRSRKGYVSYMANRPGAEKLSEHGLFGASDSQPDLQKIQEEIEGYTGNVWTHIISLRREDAARLGYDSAEAWQRLLRHHQVQIANAMKIAPEDFRWYAAFHNESHHPHIHMLAYSARPGQAYLSRQGIQQIKSALAKDIFQNDLLCLYQKQTAARDELRWESREKIQEAVERINRGVPIDPLLRQMLSEFNRRLSKAKGKKVYGYLSAGNKKLVDAIVDRLAQDESIAALYDEWYKQRFEILRTYQDSLPEKEPLSQNKEFKAIRNAVVSAAVDMEQEENETAQSSSRAYPPSVPTPAVNPVNAVVPAAVGMEQEENETVQGSSRTHQPSYQPSLFRPAVNLLYQASRIFQNNLNYEPKPSGRLVDKKEWRKIKEKMEAHGQKLEHRG